MGLDRKPSNRWISEPWGRMRSTSGGGRVWTRSVGEVKRLQEVWWGWGTDVWTAHDIAVSVRAAQLTKSCDSSTGSSSHFLPSGGNQSATAPHSLLKSWILHIQMCASWHLESNQKSLGVWKTINAPKTSGRHQLDRRWKQEWHNLLKLLSKLQKKHWCPDLVVLHCFCSKTHRPKVTHWKHTGSWSEEPFLPPAWTLREISAVQSWKKMNKWKRYSSSTLWLTLFSAIWPWTQLWELCDSQRHTLGPAVSSMLHC